MRLYRYSIILFVCFGCNEASNDSKPKKVIIDKVKTNESSHKKEQINDTVINNLGELSLVQETDNYEFVKKSIENNRIQLNSPQIKIDSVGKAFEKALINQIIPYWEGTAWSFEGHTAKPKSGTIACGYFVSTTLRDIGLNINRYQLAQQSPINEAKSLAINTEVKEISEDSNSENILAINESLSEGIHFIGFDQNHVGYLLKKHDKLYLIHSNYINSEGVKIEPIEKSTVFKSYSKFYLVELSTNKHFLQSWVSGKKIRVIQE